MKKFKDLSKKQKMFFIPLMAVMLIGSVMATGFLVNSFFINVDVYEPFGISYVILGDAGNYNGESCLNATGWETMPDGAILDMDGIYPGESRNFCVKIDNAGEADIPYTLAGSVVSGLGNYEDCLLAFPDIEKTGTASQGETIDGEVITVSTNAPPVDDCQIEISVSRG